MNSNGSSAGYRLPLEGVRVVEFGSLLAGPFSTRFFADFGAEVIKVEAPDAPDPMRDWGPAKYKGRALVWPVQSRNKKVVSINMRKPEGQELARTLIDKADIVVENFRPGTLERWGCGYEELKKRGLEPPEVSEERKQRLEAALYEPDPPVSLVLDVTAHLDQKWKAASMHRSQFGENSIFARVPPELRGEFFGTEKFYRARPAWPEGAEPETALW